jgi:hypothetical protein
MFCVLNTYDSSIAGGVPCMLPLWSATRGACRQMTLCRWPTSAPRVPRLGSLIIAAVVIVVVVVVVQPVTIVRIGFKVLCILGNRDAVAAL